MGLLQGKSTGNHRFSHEIWEFPVIFPLNQPIEYNIRSKNWHVPLIIKHGVLENGP